MVTYSIDLLTPETHCIRLARRSASSTTASASHMPGSARRGDEVPGRQGRPTGKYIVNVMRREHRAARPTHRGILVNVQRREHRAAKPTHVQHMPRAEAASNAPEGDHVLLQRSGRERKSARPDCRRIADTVKRNVPFHLRFQRGSAPRVSLRPALEGAS